MAALEAHGHSHGFMASSGKDQHWQVMILEAGIIFHSIMIGVTLGAGKSHSGLSTLSLTHIAGGGEGWSTLLIVIIFHQFFEGLALGARIALLDFDSRWTAWIMGLAFTLITPIGIAIGVGVHENFSANGKAPLLAVGILNSISAGILVSQRSLIPGTMSDLLAALHCR
jgi:zinc transporter 1/2/3